MGSIEKVREMLPWTITIEKADGRVIVFRIRGKLLPIRFAKNVKNLPASHIIKILLLELSRTPIIYVSREELKEIKQS